MISKEDIEHLKDLARVELDRAQLGGQAEIENLAKDLGGILGYVDQLKEVDVSNVAETTHTLEGIKNIFRKDKEITHPTSLTLREESDEYSTARDIIKAFPEKHDAGHARPNDAVGQGTYLKVQPIL